MKNGPALATAYFAIQAVLVAAWWVVLTACPDTRSWFSPSSSPEHDLLAFWLPDVVLLVGGSAVAAIAVFRRAAHAAAICWLVAGGVVYATLYCAALSLMTGEAWLATGLMAPAAAGTVAAAWIRQERSG